MKELKKNIIYVLLIFFAINNMQAATWLGTVSNSWADPDNWENNYVPIYNDFVFVEAGQHGPPTIYVYEEYAGIQVKVGAELIIDDNATLELRSLYYADPGILDNRGTIYNYGHIIIENLANGLENGIVNEGILNNELTGTITVDSVFAVAILNYGTVNNYNFIDLATAPVGGGEDHHHAIVNHGSFNNLALTGPNPVIPLIEIEGIAGQGIVNNDGTFLNTGGIINIGENEPVTDKGLRINGGTFTNRSLYNPSNPTNPLLAQLRINRLWTHWNHGSTGQTFPIEIMADGTLENEGGEITIGDIHTPDGNLLLSVKGTLINTCVVTNPSNPIIGTITLDHTNLNGMFVSGNFSNVGGVVNIGQTFGLSGYPFRCQSQFVTNGNFGDLIGTINVDNAPQGIELRSGGTIDNYGVINVGQNGGAQNIADYGFRMDDITTTLKLSLIHI